MWINKQRFNLINELIWKSAIYTDLNRFNQNQFGIIILIIIYIIINIIHIKVEQHEFYEVLLNEMGFYLRKSTTKNRRKSVWGLR